MARRGTEFGRSIDRPLIEAFGTEDHAAASTGLADQLIGPSLKLREEPRLARVLRGLADQLIGPSLKPAGFVAADQVPGRLADQLIGPSLKQ